ncbi:flagellar basal body P-ring formation chaperone FlgA [uncultured Desulfosarcina sp.]|uniref:flagellar basal body P-ring formation chaperone FlgA n=1 Tax=uncultured Desulfosarcina sp. TaxID=218289 RepID=UPI0029C7FE8A|nr:flagellar basal body P-ring formation chaperone FlgA [uncultured Desulfosarcina sp.]
MMVRKRQSCQGIDIGLACWVSAAILFLISVSADCADRLGLTLKAAAVVNGESVRLGDVAEVSGNPAHGAILEVEVSRSPRPGQTRFVSADYIRIRLRQAGYDTDAMIFEGPEDVKVSRPCASLPAQRIRVAVDNAIRSRMAWNSEDATISDIQFDETVQLPVGNLTYRIIPNRHEDYLGNVILALHLFVNGEPVRKLWVNATVSVMADVVTVARPLGRNQYIRLDDIRVERRDLAGLGSETIRRVEEALGNRTTRMIHPGTVLQTSMIDQPPVVKRGDIVKIIAKTGPMTITATGIVKQQGRKGEMVRVMNTDSNRVILARVAGPDAVAVEF